MAKKVLVSKSGNSVAKKSTPAQEKKAARKAEIAAAKAQADLVKNASAFLPMTSLPQYAKYASNGLELEIEHLNAEAMTPELREAAFGQMEEGERPAGGMASLSDENMQFLVAKTASNAVGFAAFHYGFLDEVNVLSLDWIFVSPDSRRKGLGKFLQEALELTAQQTQMKGVVAAVPQAWSSTHPSKRFLFELEFKMDAMQPQGKSAVQIISKIYDAEAQELLVHRAEAMKKADKAKTKLSRSAFADANMGAGSLC